MTVSSTPSRAPGPAAPRTGAPTRYPWLLVMPLRAAQEHVLVVVGEADISTAEQLRDQICAALAGRPARLRVELGGLDFCDLHGLDALHDALHHAAAAGVPLQLRGMSAQLAWMHRTFPRSTAPATPAANHAALLAEQPADARAHGGHAA